MPGAFFSRQVFCIQSTYTSIKNSQRHIPEMPFRPIPRGEIYAATQRHRRQPPIHQCVQHHAAVQFFHSEGCFPALPASRRGPKERPFGDPGCSGPEIVASAHLRHLHNSPSRYSRCALCFSAIARMRTRMMVGLGPGGGWCGEVCADGVEWWVSE